MVNQVEFAVNSNRELDYWQNKLKKATPLLDFPTDKSRANFSSANDRAIVASTAQHSFTVARNTAEALQSIASQQNVSLATVLFTAFQVLLYRYTNQADNIIGYANYEEQKSARQLEIIPIRTVVERKKKFTALLLANQELIVEANEYANIDIYSLVEAIGSKAGCSLSSWLQMLFQFNSSPTPQAEWQEVLRPELNLSITKTPQNLSGSLEYNSYLHSENTIERLINNYQILLDSIAIEANTVNSLPLISPVERQQVLFAINQTQAESIPQCVHQLFEARVNANPQAIAIVCGEQQLTYGELNQQANQLARYLQIKGVSKGSLVGLCIERSPSMVVGVLAILKAGGAYVPLDIGNPRERLAFILEDARVKVLLTQADLLDRLPEQIEQTICGDRDRHLISQSSQANLHLDVTISDLAHIVYTSGSTGKPKGVMLTHGNLSHYAQSLKLAFNITPADTYLHRGSIALIVSARQLLMPLAQGATAVIVTPEETRNPLEFFQLIKRRGVTIVDHVPSFWRNFWGILNQQSASFRADLLDNQVRLVAAGGEQVTPEIYQCWRETFKPEVQLANIYGQTEGTGVVTVYQIPEQVDCSFKSLPVGRPIPNMKVYILDADLQPVPMGVVGEIHISGAGVALGYLNRPELTAEKFVPNPYIPGEKIYKTGDLGRLLPNSSVQFLGRVDRQVNIQGLRIELGEIEAVLSQHSLVQEAAVVVRNNKLGETLCAYIVPSPKQKPTAKILRNYLAAKLPAYMIPSRFLLVKEFLQTTSGKVDRRALSALKPEASTPIVEGDAIAQEIVQMLQEILGITTISTKDNFIELGGNSLLAARLVTEIEHKYEQSIPISSIFQAPTPEALAELIGQDRDTTYPKSFVPIKQGNAQPILFAVHNLGYGLEFYLPLAKHLQADVSLYGLSSSFDDDADKPHFRDIVKSAAYYARDLQKIQPEGPYHLLAVSFGGVIAYEIAQILVAQGHEVEFLGLVDTYCPQQNAVYQPPSVKDRALSHLKKIRTKGLKHIFQRVQWRANTVMDNVRYELYKIDWLRENFVDRTSRSYGLTQYIQEKKEHQQVNQGYTIRPYPGKVSMFRAADDADSKLDWQDLAESGLSIYDIPGEHLEILQEPTVQILAAKIQLALRQ